MMKFIWVAFLAIAWGAVDVVEQPIQAHHITAPEKIPFCSKELLQSIKGYLLDLDGTVYKKEGLLAGVQPFFDWMESAKMDYVLLSNGFKSNEGVAAKFANEPFKLRQRIDPKDIHTAGRAIAAYMKDNAPPGSRIYSIGTSVTYGDGSKDSLKRILERYDPEEFKSWTYRTDLNMDEIYEWAKAIKKGEKVFVLLAPMTNPNDGHEDDPVTKKSGYSQMDFELMKKINTLLRNGAFFVVGSPDLADSQPKLNGHPEVDTAWPTTGGYEHLFLMSAEMFPGSKRELQYHVNVGKGGNRGAQYMMKPGMEILKSKKPTIENHEIAIVGDNFGTDILAGNQAGIKTILVLVGAHQLDDAVNWPSQPTCYINDVGDIPKILGNNSVPKRFLFKNQTAASTAVAVDTEGS